MAMASRRALHLLTSSSSRGISSTPHLASLGWLDKIKATVTDKIKTAITGNDDSLSSFTMRKYANGMDASLKAGVFKNDPHAGAMGTFAAVLRYLHSVDPTGENVKSSDKISATEHCNCTVAHVEHALARFAWAREAHKTQLKLREEGIPVPRTATEMQKYMDKTPMDVLRSNLAKSDLIKKNSNCPCGSSKQYKSNICHMKTVRCFNLT